MRSTISGKTVLAFLLSLLMVALACSSVPSILQESANTTDSPVRPEGTSPAIATVEPRSTPVPSSEASGEKEASSVELLEFETFNSDGRNPRIAIKIRNPNAALTLVDIDVEVFLRDAEGVATDNRVLYHRISYLLPEATIAIVRPLDTSKPVDQLLPVATHRTYLDTHYAEPLLTSNQTLIESELDGSIQVSAVVENPNDNYADISATAVLYDDEDNVIGGGGIRPGSYVLPQAATGVMLDLKAEEPPDRFELYVWPSKVAPCLFVVDCSDSTLSKQPRVVDSGFTQDGEDLTYGFIVDNPNGDFALERVVYGLTAYGDDGTVLHAGPGEIGCQLPPGEGHGIGAVRNLETTRSIDRLDIVVYPEEQVEFSPVPSYQIRNVSHYIGSLDIPYLELSIANPSAQSNRAIIGAVTYDQAGGITGGATLVLHDLAPNQESFVEQPYWIIGNPEIHSVEFFPMVGCQ